MNGEAIVRFEGAKLETLLSIRRGEWSFDEIMAHAEKIQAASRVGFRRVKHLIDVATSFDPSRTSPLFLLNTSFFMNLRRLRDCAVVILNPAGLFPELLNEVEEGLVFVAFPVVEVLAPVDGDLLLGARHLRDDG